MQGEGNDNGFCQPSTKMSDTRLIERWLLIAALGEESIRERRSMTALPPIYYLHVWWARCPLVASRAAVLASLLPEDADRERFLHVIGIHGDSVVTRRRIDAAKRTALTTALERELGLEPRVAREVEEVAQDIWRDLAKLREGQTEDRGASAYPR